VTHGWGSRGQVDDGEVREAHTTMNELGGHKCDKDVGECGKVAAWSGWAMT
jgi:hypothetical protein